LTEGEPGWCGGGVEGEALGGVVLWYRLAIDGVVTGDRRVLRCKWRAAAVVLRGINAFIVHTNVGDFFAT
jgi:hypothetical protein